MADIHIHRAHRLGLARARKLAWNWAEAVEQKFGLECTVLEGETSDTVQFRRAGVTGELIVAPDHFELQARLGLLLGAFVHRIKQEIEQELDTLLGAPAPGKTAARKPRRK